MLEKRIINFVKSLRDKKSRYTEMRFVAEGIKSVSEILESKIRVHAIYTTLDLHTLELPLSDSVVIQRVTEKEMSLMSSLKTPSAMLGVFELPQREITTFKPRGKITLVLDTIQDPGNLGTIIRIADWYGIQSIICSEETVDAYNAKTIQASMASIGRVDLFYTDLDSFFAKNPQYQLLASTLENAEPISTFKPSGHMFLLIGNEGKGIRNELIHRSRSRICIERLGAAESLNAAVATAILCDRLFQKTEWHIN